MICRKWTYCRLFRNSSSIVSCLSFWIHVWYIEYWLFQNEGTSKMYWKLETPMISIPKRREPQTTPELAFHRLTARVFPWRWILQRSRCGWSSVNATTSARWTRERSIEKNDSGMIVRIIVRIIRSQDEERYGKIEIDRSGMVDKGG